MQGTLLSAFQALKAEGRKGLAVLVDPDKASEKNLRNLVLHAERSAVNFLFVGGSLMVNLDIRQVTPLLKNMTRIPVILFPGSLQQVVPDADGILFLSLISGRNPELLIGAHVLAAPMLRQSDLEVLPTGYMLVDGGKSTTVHYISNTLPIPHDKPDIAVCTALAGEMLGLRLIYLDAGSGAKFPVSPEMVRAVANEITVPLIVGGGIRTADQAAALWDAGADVIVVGNRLEEPDGPELLDSIAAKRFKIIRKDS